MIRSFFAAGLLLAAIAAWAAQPADALLDGQMPDDPARALVQGKCLLCHSSEYVTQQRLSEGQWQKTVEKMRKFGSPATDDEAKAMVAYLARYWTQDLPPPHPVRTAPPPGSTHAK